MRQLQGDGSSPSPARSSAATWRSPSNRVFSMNRAVAMISGRRRGRAHEAAGINAAKPEVAKPIATRIFQLSPCRAGLRRHARRLTRSGAENAFQSESPCYGPSPTQPIASRRRGPSIGSRSRSWPWPASSPISCIEGLTFDDVLLRPGRSEVLPADADICHPADRIDQPQPADHRLRHGHGDRGPDGHRHGAGRRHRRHPPQPRAGRAGRAGPAGEALRVRHGGEPDHHPARGDASPTRST